MKTIYAKCKVAGTLILNTATPITRGEFVDTDLTGCLEHYTFKTPVALLSVVADYDNVILSGKKIKGKRFTLKQAEQLFHEN